MKPYIEEIYILSTLLHYANLSASSDSFYALKNRLLDRYGTPVGYDVQTLDGKKCWTCDGTGIYRGYYWESGKQWTDTCNRCWRGWFKPPCYNVLIKRRFGRYTFHTPVERFYSKKELGVYISEHFHEWKGDLFPDSYIEGYVDHRRSRWSESALIVLFLLFDRAGLSTIWTGWACYWWLPYNWLNNALHLWHYRSRAIPISNLRKKWHRLKLWAKHEANICIFEGRIDDDDIPF